MKRIDKVVLAALPVLLVAALGAILCTRDRADSPRKLYVSTVHSTHTDQLVAIEDHYFNSSTSGQWLWDEIQAQVHAGKAMFEFVTLRERTNATNFARSCTGKSLICCKRPEPRKAVRQVSPAGFHASQHARKRGPMICSVPVGAA
jgi:hypothetical protein